MAKKFDPYDRWFNIPPGEQPPDHYRLLGIDRFESETAVINEAAEQRVAFLHDVATGPQVAMTQRLLNEVAAARLCLTDPEKKSAYDAKLKQPPAPKRPPRRAEEAIPVATVPRPSAPPKAIPQATPISPPPVKGQDEFAVVTDGQTGGTDATSQHASKTAKKKPPVWLAAGGVVALVLVLVIVVIAASSKDDSPAKSGDKEEGQRPVATRNIRGGAKQDGKVERQADRSPTDLADAVQQHNSTQSQRQTPSSLPTGSFDGTGGASGWSFGAGGLSDSRVSTKGLVLWLDAGEVGTVSSLTSVRRWIDKSGKGNDAVSSPKVQSPTHRDRLINDKPGLEFQTGQRLTVKHKPQLNLGANYTIAFVAGGTGPLLAKGNSLSDKPTNGFALQPNLSQLRFSNKHACPAQNDNPSELRVRIVVANQKSVTWFIAGKAAGKYEGPHEIKNNAALQIGRFNPENPRSGFNGKLAELLIYNRPIGDDERQKIEEYLSGKWLK